jgi:hypothetical protein
MKTTLTFGPSFLALFVAFAPACTVTVKEGPDEEGRDSGRDGTSTAENDGGRGGSSTSSDDDGGASSSTTGPELTVEIDTNDAAVVGDGGDGAASPAGDLRQGCGEAEITDEAMIVSGPIEEPTTWSGVVVIERSLNVNDGADLTIEPGTHIIIGNDVNVELGWNGGALKVDAQGTEEAPIIVCGKRAERGYWRNVTVGRNVLSESVLSNVRIFDGGGDSDAALMLDASVVVDQVLVSGSESAGVRAVDFEEESSGLSVQDSGRAVLLESAAAATHFPLGGELSDNDEALARVRFTSTTIETVFFQLGVPYLQERSLAVNDGATILFAAGVEYRFAADTNLEVGWNSGAVSIGVNGTEDEPVVFRGQTEQAGYWGGVFIRGNVRSDSKLSYLQIRHGGGESVYALDVESAVVLDHVELVDNEWGMRVNEDGLDEDSTSLTIMGTESYPLTIDPEAIVTIPSGGAFSGNETDQIVVTQGNFQGSGTVPNLAVPYRIEGRFQTDDGSELTIAAGTEFVMAPDSSVEFGWNGGSVLVTAVGTEAEPIRFTGAVQEAGSWGGITFGTGAQGASQFKYVELSHGGGDGAVLTLRESIQVDNCTFANYEGAALRKLASDLTDYEANNVFDGDVTVEDL